MAGSFVARETREARIASANHQFTGRVVLTLGIFAVVGTLGGPVFGLAPPPDFMSKTTPRSSDHGGSVVTTTSGTEQVRATKQLRGGGSTAKSAAATLAVADESPARAMPPSEPEISRSSSNTASEEGFLSKKSGSRRSGAANTRVSIAELGIGIAGCVLMHSLLKAYMGGEEEPKAAKKAA